MIYITRKESFNAAHRLYRPELTDKQNFEIFGKCSNPNWHGHNYTLFVTVKGNIDSYTGYSINLKELSQIIKSNIIEHIDHKNLNLDVEFFKDKITSAENIAIEIFKILSPIIASKNCLLHCVKLVETENNFVEYFGE